MSVPPVRKPSPPRPKAHRYALESRQMYDGAALVEAAHHAEGGDPGHGSELFHTAAAVPPTPAASAPEVHKTAPASDARPASAAAAPQVYVVDQSVSNWRALVDQLPKGSEVIVLDDTSSGLDQLADALKGQHDIGALHIISHGSSDAISLGTDAINTSNISSHAGQLGAIGASLAANGDILLYGCDVAAQDHRLISQLSSLTRADVAASTDDTGAASQGGDWTLEAATGSIEAKSLSLDYDGLLAAPTVATTAKSLSVAEPSVLNAAGASTGTLDGWSVTDDGNVTVTAVVHDPAVGTLATGSGGSAIAGGYSFTGTAAEAATWLNQLTFTAADVELGTTAATTSIDVTVKDVATSATSTTSLAVTVAPSNDPTTFGNTPIASTAMLSQSVDEIANTPITAATLGLDDPEVSNGSQSAGQQVYDLTAAPTHGYLALDGVRLGVGSTFTQQDVLDGNLVYVHTDTGTATQDTADAFSLQVNDGATPISQSARATVTLDITPVNQAPTVTGAGIVFEGQPANAAGTGAVGNYITANGGGDDADGALALTLTSLPTDGTLYFTGTVTHADGSTTTYASPHAISSADIAGSDFSFAYTDRGYLTYANTGQKDNLGTGSYPGTDSFGVIVTDAGGGAGTGSKLAASATVSLDVHAVDDDPTLDGVSTLAATVPGNGTYAVTLTTAMLGAADVDTPDGSISFAITQTSLDQGYLLLNGMALQAGSTFTLADVEAGRVTYVQTGAANAGDTDSFHFQLVDNTTALRWNPDGSTFDRIGGDYAGGAESSPLQDHVFTIDLAPLPTGTDGSYDFATAGTQHQDSSYAGLDPSGNAIGTITEGGSIVLGGTGAASGIPYLSYTATGNDGQAIDPAQVIYTFTGFTSDGAGTGTAGTLQKSSDGTTWTDISPYGTFTQADLNAGHIRFQHDGDSEDFATAASFSVSAGVVTVQNGQAVTDQWTPTFDVYITPANDAPTVVGSSSTVIKQGDIAYLTTGQLQLGDPDDATSESYLENPTHSTAGGDPALADGNPDYAVDNAVTGADALKFLVTSLPAGGTLQYSTDGGGSWQDVTANTALDASIITGSAGTTGLRFVSDNSEVRSTSFTVAAQDRWGATSATNGTVTIQITNLDDAPQIASDPTQADPGIPAGSPNEIGGAPVNDPLTVAEGGYGQITSALLQAYDPDSTDTQVQYAITGAPAHGRLAYSTDGGATFHVLGAGSSFTQADVAAGRIYYLNDGTEPTGSTYAGTPDDKFTFTVSDGDKEQTGNQFWIYTSPTNDVPVVTAPTGPLDVASATSSNDPIAGFSIADPDLSVVSVGETDFVQATVRLLDASGDVVSNYTGVSIGYATPGDTGGLWAITHNGNGDVLQIQGTREQVNAALAGLTVAFADDRDATYQVQVIADDRLRDATGTLTGGANGGTLNQGATPGTIENGLPVDPSDYDWTTAAIPTTDSIGNPEGNISAGAVTIHASSINEAPTITAPSSTTVNEDVRTRLTGLSYSDADAFDSTSNTLTLAVGTGSLYFSATGTTAPAGVTITAGSIGSSSITLTGSHDALAAALASLYYRSAANYNGDDTLHVAIDDGGNTGIDGGTASLSDSKDVAISILPVNDTPTLAMPTGNVHVTGSSFTFDGANSISFDDAADRSNANSGFQAGVDSYTVTLEATKGGTDYGSIDLLTAPDGSVTMTGAGTAKVTLTGSYADVSAALANNVRYTSTDTNIDQSIVFRVTVDDGNNGGTKLTDPTTGQPGITGTPTVTKSVTLQTSSDNDPPAFAGLDNTPTYVQNSNTAVVLDGNAVLSDPELDLYDNWNGAVLTLSRDGGANANDIFGTTGSGSTGVNISGSSLRIGTTTVGTVTNTGGTLSITFNGNATASRVDQILQGLTYRNTDTAPERQVTIDYTINDENDDAATHGTAGTGQDQGDGGALIGTGSIAVTINRQVVAAADANDIDEGVASTDTSTVGGDLTPGTTGQDSDPDTDYGQSIVVQGVTAGTASSVTTVGTAGVGSAVTGTYGSLTVSADGSYTYALDNGKAAVQALRPGDTVTDTFSYAVNDGQDGNSTQAWSTVTITIHGKNDAPVLTHQPLSVTQAEDAATPSGAVGSQVSTLTGGITDVDSGALKGLAITGQDSSLGQWWYSTDNGTSWTALPAASDASALLLAPTDRLYFQPAANANGQVNDGLTFRAWDQTSGTHGSSADTTVNGGTTAFSTATDTVPLDVTPLNDAPILGGTASNPTATENTGLGTGVAAVALLNGASIADVDPSTTGGLDGSVFGAVSVTVALDGYQSGDQLFADAAVLAANHATVDATDTGNGTQLVIHFGEDATFANVDAVLGALSYRSSSDNPTDYGAAPTRTYHVTVNDGDNQQAGGDAGANGALDSNTITGTITIAAVDDPPVAVDDTNQVDEDAAAPATGNVITGIGSPATIADSDPDNLPSELSVVGIRTGTEASGGTMTAVGAGTDSTSGTAIAGSYGSLRIGADGSYSYALDNDNATVNALKDGQSLTETFTYTLTDGAATDTAQVTITIHGHTDGAPTLAPVDGNGSVAGQATVSESGLTDTSGSQTAAGSIDLTAPDGLGSVTVGGTTLTTAQLEALNSGTPVAIDTPEGTLTLTGFTPGTVVGGVPTRGTLDYSYTLDHPVSQPGLADSTDTIALTVTDVDGSQSSGSLVIDIVDDTPTANPDTADVDEDGAAVSGNVVTGGSAGDVADRIGADATATPVSGVSFGSTTGAIGTALSGNYGALILNADGSYSYAVDNGNATVNALKDGQSLTDTYSYTVTDADGDTSTATLTVTIHGHTDGAPSIMPHDGNGAGNGTATSGDATVYESGLTTDGPTGEGKAATDTIAISAPDGLASITVGATTLDLADLGNLSTAPKTITTPDGSLVLTGFITTASVGGVPTAGTLRYTYTLGGALNQPGLADSTDTIALTVTDVDGSQSGGILAIDIVDDTPTANPDTADVDEDGAAVSGNVVTGGSAGDVADRIGADATATPVSGVSFGGTAGALGTALSGNYGALILNADGSYGYTVDNGNATVNALKDGQSLTDIYSYTITDADGDTSTATLTVTLHGHTDGAPTLAPVDGNGSVAGQATVSESGLTDTSGSQTATGSIDLTAPDGLGSVTVGGTTLTTAQLDALSGGTPVAIDTPEGTLMLTGFTPGTVIGGVPTSGTLDYTYTLDHPVSQPGLADSTDAIALTVTDVDGSQSSGILAIDIVDDTPTANPDTADVDEDGAAVSGNVVTGGSAGDVADRIGADATATPVSGVSFGGTTATIGTALNGNYGALTLNADGSYSYAVDNGNATVNALKDGDSLTDIYSYTITDADGDTRTTTLTVTLHGHTDGAPSIVPHDGNGPGESVGSIGDATVYESGLTADGPTGQDRAASDTIALSAPDGLAGIEVGGIALNAAQLASLSAGSPIVVTTANGVLVLTGFDVAASNGGIPTAGTLHYTYTLGGRVDQAGADQSTDTIALTVTDVDDSQSNGSLVIDIVDDVPTARADTASIDEDGPATVTGNVVTGGRVGDVADRIGADTTATPVSGISFGGTAGTIGTALDGNYGALTLNADGSYGYAVDNGNATVNALKDGQSLTDTYSYTITDADGDTSTATLTVTLHGHTDGAPTLAPVDGNGSVAGQATVSESGLTDTSGSQTAAGSIDLTAPDGLGSITVGGTTLTTAQLNALNGGAPIAIDTPEGTLTLTGFTPGTVVGGVPTAGALDYSYTLDHPVSQLGLADSADTIALTVTDVDGSQSSGILVIDIVDDAPTANPDTADVDEDGAAVSGNVVTGGSAGDVADRIGADATATPVSGVSFGSTTGAIGTALNGNYGALTLNADGSYSYAVDNGNATVNALKNGDSLTDTYSYTITDADGDTSTATLTVSIHGHTDGTPTIAPVDGNGGVIGQATVNESGLTDGSGSQTTTGSIDLTSPDGLGSITVGGTTLTTAQLEALSGGAPIAIDTPEGTLTLTGFTPGTVVGGVPTAGTLDYIYTLDHPVSQPGATDSTDTIAITVTDVDGSQSSGILAIDIVNDAPTANPDTAVVEQDLGITTTAGNVLQGSGAAHDGADRIGADGPAAGGPVTAVTSGNSGLTGRIGAPSQGEFGTLTLNADGSYTYVLDTRNAKVAALDADRSLSEVFVYTITDADGGASQATLTITIGGLTPPIQRHGDPIFPIVYDRTRHDIRQEWNPGLFILPVVHQTQRDTLQATGALVDGDEAIDGDAVHSALLAMPQDPENAQHVLRDGVGFAQRVLAEIRGQRRVAPNDFGLGHSPLWDDFSPFAVKRVAGLEADAAQHAQARHHGHEAAAHATDTPQGEHPAENSPHDRPVPPSAAIVIAPHAAAPAGAPSLSMRLAQLARAGAVPRPHPGGLPAVLPVRPPSEARH